MHFICRQLICKIEEINITLRKHLAKEEAQLLPLLLQHFSHAEQAELVAQFLYCIPLDTVERVLSWLKPMVPMEELLELMQHLRDVIPDRLLLQLLVTWLNPAAGPTAAAAAAAAGGSFAAVPGSSSSPTAVAQVSCDAAASGSKLVICPFASEAIKQPVGLAGPAPSGGRSSDASSKGTGTFCAARSGVMAGQVAAAVAASVQQWPPLRVRSLRHPQ